MTRSDPSVEWRLRGNRGPTAVPSAHRARVGSVGHRDHAVGAPGINRLSPTPRQLDVLRAYIETGSYPAAAAQMEISVHTVQAHLASLRDRLGVHNESQAVFVLCLGYLDHLSACVRDGHVDCHPWGRALVSRAPEV